MNKNVNKKKIVCFDFEKKVLEQMVIIKKLSFD